MRLIVISVFYEEQPAHLAAFITALGKIPVDHLIMVDGAWFLMPDAKPRSDHAQIETIIATADALGIGLTLHQPDTVWQGNEVEKRNASIRIAEAISDPDDWYLVFDVDEVVWYCGPDLRERLAASECLVAAFELDQRNRVPGIPIRAQQGMELCPITRSSIRRIYKATRGLFYDTAHYIVGIPWGEGIAYLNGDLEDDPLDCEDLGAVLQLEHRADQRTEWRTEQKKTYYDRRNQLGIESRFNTVMASVDGGLATVPNLYMAGPDGEPVPIPAAPTQVRKAVRDEDRRR